MYSATSAQRFELRVDIGQGPVEHLPVGWRRGASAVGQKPGPPKLERPSLLERQALRLGQRRLERLSTRSIVLLRLDGLRLPSPGHAARIAQVT